MGALQRPHGSEHEAARRRWAEVRSAAEAALALAPRARAGFLDRSCGADSTLRAEVEAQVEACERAAHSPTFLAEPAAALATPLLAEVPGAGGDERTGVSGLLRQPTADPKEVEAALRNALAGHGYEVERELGNGGTATVYLAHDRRHGRLVALKVFDPVLGAALSGERFLREIRVTAGLMHPHILPLHDSGEAAGRLYYVMPYVAGETLRERLAREGSLPVPDALRLVREVASALDYAHRHGVVHRDIKPANILLAEGHAVVADFGIARAVHRAREAAEPDAACRGTRAAEGGGRYTLTAMGTSPGTPAYMAPEQARGGAVDERADLYALGVVAYEALAGEHPYGNWPPDVLHTAHLTAQPPSLAARRPDFPPELAALVMQLLARDPADRPPSAAAVLRSVDGLPASPGRRAAARRRAVLASAALLLFLGAGGYAVSRRGPVPHAGDAGVAPLIRSIAVLPFANTSGDPQDDFFSDGLTDELTHALTHVPGLRVAGRTSSYALKGKAVAAQEVGRRLGVDAFVSATVRRAGDRLRVHPQLVSTADATVLWDSVFESRSRDVFAVQDSLTRAVVAALVPALGARGGRDRLSLRDAVRTAIDVERGTNDAEAYELYLKGRYYWHERGAENVARSIGLFQQAIGRDPTFARAYAALAFAYGVLGIYTPDRSDSAGARLRASARQAMTLDSTLADAHLAEALALQRDSRFAEAEAHYHTALRLEPSNPTVRHAFGAMLTGIGRTDAAIAELRQATHLDPLAKSAGTMLAEALIDARRFREAEDEARRILSIDSTFSLALFSLGLAQAFGAQPDSAVRTLERGVQLYPELLAIRGRLLFAYAAAGRWENVERMRAQLRRPGGDRSGGALPAFADFLLGNREPLLRLVSTPTGLRRWSDALRMTFTVPGCNPLADPLWEDAGYRAAMRRLGVGPCPPAPEWPLPPRPDA